MASKWNVGDCLPDLTHDERRWEIKKVLGGTGKSGMGVVYVVYDRAWKKTFAAKTFQDEAFARSPQVAKRFIQEAHTWINLGSHPNVTQAHFIYRIPSQPPHFTGNYAWLERVEARPFLFLEYVRGDDLAAWIGTARLTGNLSQVLHFTIQFCDGMIHALSKGIKAHRDIKPQNCLISDDGTLKVTDFGLAKVVDDAMNELDDSPEIYEWLGDSPQFVSHTGKRGGTPAYMAPEQFTDTKRVDVRADVYSFGVMLYEMVTGRLPFQGRTWDDFCRMHQDAIPPALPRSMSMLTDCIKACLEKNPEKRFPTFAALRASLARIYEDLTRRSSPRQPGEVDLSPVDLSNKGVGLLTLGHLTEAMACFEQALKLNPLLDTTWVCKGSVLARMGQEEESLACYQRALEINPQMATAWYNRGLSLGKLGRWGEALGSFDQAANLGDGEARFMAETVRKQGPVARLFYRVLFKFGRPRVGLMEGILLRLNKTLALRRAYKRPAEPAEEDRSPTAGVPKEAAERFMDADIHYQLRALVEEFPPMHSEKYLHWVEDYWLKNEHRPESNTYQIYKARWVRNCYPGPSPEVCKGCRKRGSDIERYFVSIESGLRGRTNIPAKLRRQWASEASGAMLQAGGLDEMRVVAMNYPILLRPAVQGGIDAQLEGYSDPERSIYLGKLQLLQQLREEIEGHPIKSWWRPGGDPDPVSGKRSH